MRFSILILVFIAGISSAFADVKVLEKVLKCGEGIKKAGEANKMEPCLLSLLETSLLASVKREVFFFNQTGYTKVRNATCEFPKANQLCAEVDLKGGGEPITIIYRVKDGKITMFEAI